MQKNPAKTARKVDRASLWLAACGLLVIFGALYILRVDLPVLTPNEQMLQNVD